MSEKRFEATPGRLERAKREGDVAMSQELSAVAAFAAALLAVNAAAPPLARAFGDALASAARGGTNRGAIASTLTWMALPAVCGAAAACACAAVQAGGMRFVPLKIAFARLSPAENLKRMFSRESVVTAVRACAAFACAALAIAPAAAAMVTGSLRAPGAAALAQSAWSGSLRGAAAACAVGGLFAGADFALQSARRRKRLRMSFEDLKRDHKEHEGDPLARGRRRALHRAMAKASLVRVKDAAFVVTNPTHIAIALEYRPPDVAVPRVIVRAADDAASTVRELAAAHGIPLVEQVALARELYARCKPGDYIPQETYIAVAEVVAALSKSGALG